MPPAPLLAGAYANLATEEWITQERTQLRSLFDIRLMDFHQSYVDDVSWLNEYMGGLCESSRSDLLQAMKTPSRFQSVRKLNAILEVKGIQPVGRLFSDSTVTAESTRTATSSGESTMGADGVSSIEPRTAGRTEQRGSLIVHHDSEEDSHLSMGIDSSDLSTETLSITSDHESIVAITNNPPKPLNEIVEEEEDDDEVVTVLKTPRPNALQMKSNAVSQQTELLESPLAAKSGPIQNEDLDLEGSDKENVPLQNRITNTSTTPRPSDRSDSYVTALTSIAQDDLQPSQVHTHTETVSETHPEEGVIETQVPVVTSPPEHQMQLPSLPTRAPLNMKKSFGVRKSQRTSLLESIGGRTSIIPNRKTFFGQMVQSQQLQPTEPVLKPSEAKSATEPSTTTGIPHPLPSKEQSTTNDQTKKKEKDDTITIIDTELQMGEQRLKTKFTTESQRIFDALNSLKNKSTPGQTLRDEDHEEKSMEIETPAPIRTAKEGREPQVIEDEEDEWIPKKDYASLTTQLSNPSKDEPVRHVNEVVASKTEVEMVTTDNAQHETIKSVPRVAPVEKNPSQIPQLKSPVVSKSILSPSAMSFKNAAAYAVEVIRNARAIIQSPSHDVPPPPPAQPQTNLYPKLTDDLDDEPMLDIQPSENFTIHYDDDDNDSKRDSTYFSQSDVPSQPTQPDNIARPSIAQQEHRQSHVTTAPMPPPQPRKEFTKPKPMPVKIHVPTASQRQKEQQKKALTQTATATTSGIYPTLTQSRSVPDLASPGKLAMEQEHSRMSSVSVQSTGAVMRGAGQIKSLNAAKLAKQREEQEREKKALKKFEMDKKRQEAVKKRQEEEKRRQLPGQGRVISKGDNRKVGPAAENLRPAKKLPSSPAKKPVEATKVPRPPQVQAQKAVKRGLEAEDKPRTANYTSAGKSVAPSQHGQDIKRRRTDEVEEHEIINVKAMRVSVVKQDAPKPTKSFGEPIRQPYTAEPKKAIKISSAHQFAAHPTKSFMAPAEGVKFTNDPIPFGKPNGPSQGKRSGPPPPQPAKEPIYPPSESIVLPEIDSEYSDSEDESPKKQTIVKPSWAESPILVAQLKRQQMINPDDVFGEIKPPAIDDIFRNNNRRGHSTFRPRSSSANWSGQDKLTREEMEEYARTMGYSKP